MTKKNIASVLKVSIACLLAAPVLAQAQTYTNTNTTGTVLWSAGAWSPSPPVSSSTTVLTFSGALAAAANLQNDLGVFNLTTLNVTHTNAFVLTISGNQLSFNGTSNLINFNSGQADIVSAPITFVNGLTVSLGAFQNYTLSGTITGSGGLIKNSTNSTLTLSGNNSYTGGTTLNGSLVLVGNNNAFGGAGGGTVLLNAGTLAATGGARTLANAFQIGGNITLIESNNTSDLTISGAVNLLGSQRTITAGGTLTTQIATLSGAVSNGGIVKEGRSTLKLTGTNSYAGGTTINNGALQFGTNASIPATGTVTVNAGGALAVNLTSGNTTVTSWLIGGKLATNSTGAIALKGNSSEAIDFNTNGFTELALGAFAAATYTGTLTPAGTIYRLGGGGATLTLSNTNALTGAKTLMVGPVLAAGSVNSNLIGAQTSSGGTVALSAANDLTGATTVNSSTLSLTGLGAIADSDVTVKPGAVLNFAPSTGTVTRTKSLALNTGTLTVTGAAANTGDVITNAITIGNGLSTITLTPNAAGNLLLSANALTRSTGALLLVRGVAFGTAPLAAPVVNTSNVLFTTTPAFTGSTAVSGTTIRMIPWAIGGSTAASNGSDFLTYDSTTGLRLLTGSEVVTTFASGNATQDNAKITSAITGINAATTLNSLVLGTGGSVAGSDTLTLASGGLLSTGAATSIGTTVNFGSNEAIVTPITGSTLTITGDITGDGGLTKNGAGTLLATGAKTYTGVTTINAGSLSTNSLTDGGSNSGIGASSNAAANLVLNGGSLLYTGTIAASSDRLFSVGLGGGAVRNDASAALTLTNTGAMGFNGESGPRILTLTGGANTNTLAAVIGDNGGPTTVLKALGSTWVLSGTNTYTGPTKILGDTNNGAGILSVSVLANGGQPSSIGASSNAASNLILNRGTLKYTGGTTSTDRLFTFGTIQGSSSNVIDGSGTGAVTFSNPGAIEFTAPSPHTFTLTGTNTDDNTLTPIIGDSGATTVAHQTAFTKSGVGKWVLAGLNTYTGVTTISAGTLSIASLANGGSASGIGASSNAAANLVLGTATLQYTGGTVSTDRNFTLTNATTSTVEVTSPGANLTISGASTATTGGLIKTGAGGLTLAGASLYTGKTTINQGTLSVGTLADGGSPSGIGASSNAAANLVLGGGTLQYTGVTVSTNRNFTLTTDTISNIGVTTPGANLTITGGSTATTGGLTKTGAGTLTLDGFNLHSGPTTVAQGTLLVNTSLTSSAVDVNNTGTLAGIGFVSTVSVNTGGTLAPGVGVGQLDTSALVFANGSAFALELGATDGDKVVVTGPALLVGTIALGITLTGQPENSSYTILDGSEPLLGYGAGARFSFGGNPLDDGESFNVTTGAFSQMFQINYAGNDVVLTVVPEPAACLSLLGGLGLLAGLQRRRRPSGGARR